MKHFLLSRFSSWLCAAVAVAAFQISAQGQTYKTWDGSSSTDFLNGANWDTGVPNSGQVGLFQDAPTANQPDLTADRTVNGLSFTTATGGWTLSPSSRTGGRGGAGTRYFRTSS